MKLPNFLFAPLALHGLSLLLLMGAPIAALAQADSGPSAREPDAPGDLQPIAHSAPAPAAAAPYTVGSGDILNISVWKEPDLSSVVTVRPDGKISMPLVGELVVLGLTPVQVAALLHGRLDSLVVHPEVTVTVSEIHSRMVFITGEVGRPGAYSLNGPLDVLQLIAQAGGLTEYASRRKIRILRASDPGKGIPFDYNRAMHGDELARTLNLAPGDTVIVP